MRAITDERAFVAAPDVPELGAVVQIERSHRAGGLGGLHALDDQLTGGGRQCREDAAAVEPAHARAEDGRPIEVARLEHGAGFVGPVVEDHRTAHAVAAIAVDGGHVGAVDAVMLEALVERLHAHGPHPFGDQISDRVVHHGGGDTGLQAESNRRGWRRS